MPSSGTLRRVALAKTGVSEEPRASIISVTRIDDLGRLSITSNRRTLRSNTKFLQETYSMTSPEDGFLYSHCREKIKSYIYTLRQNIFESNQNEKCEMEWEIKPHIEEGNLDCQT
jgi:hypothetical protein